MPNLFILAHWYLFSKYDLKKFISLPFIPNFCNLPNYSIVCLRQVTQNSNSPAWPLQGTRNIIYQFSHCSLTTKLHILTYLPNCYPPKKAFSCTSIAFSNILEKTWQKRYWFNDLWMNSSFHVPGSGSYCNVHLNSSISYRIDLFAIKIIGCPKK